MEKKIKGIISLCFNPISIVSPIPFLALAVFSISYVGPFTAVTAFKLLWACIFSLSSHSAANLWNHINDIEVDKQQGKKNALIDKTISLRLAIILAILFYIIPLLIISKNSVEKMAILLYVIWVIVTWVYSDKLWFGRYFKRFKEHYVGELVTYSISWPTYTLVLWAFFNEFTTNSYIVAIAFMFLGLSGLFLKDIKDISGDERANLKTLGVVFPPSFLLKISSLLLIVYYIVLVLLPLYELVPLKYMLIIVPFVVYLIFSLRMMVISKWKISIKQLPAIKIMSYSTFASVAVLALLIFL